MLLLKTVLRKNCSVSHYFFRTSDSKFPSHVHFAKVGAKEQRTQPVTPSCSSAIDRFSQQRPCFKETKKWLFKATKNLFWHDCESVGSPSRTWCLSSGSLWLGCRRKVATLGHCNEIVFVSCVALRALSSIQTHRCHLSDHFKDIRWTHIHKTQDCWFGWQLSSRKVQR